jgi:hypothetical protein
MHITLDFQVGNGNEYFKGTPAIYVGGYAALPFTTFEYKESTRSYLTVRFSGTPLFSKISKVESFLPHILCKPVDVFFFICLIRYHRQVHFQLDTNRTNQRLTFSLSYPIL